MENLVALISRFYVIGVRKKEFLHQPHDTNPKRFRLDFTMSARWNNSPPESTIGLLRLYGLLIVGKMPQGSKLYKVALIPKEIQTELQKIEFGG